MNQIECGEGDHLRALSAVGMQLGFGVLFAAVTLWAFRDNSRTRATPACGAGAA